MQSVRSHDACSVCVLQLEWAPDQRKAVKKLPHWECHRYQLQVDLTIQPILQDKVLRLVIL